MRVFWVLLLLVILPVRGVFAQTSTESELHYADSATDLRASFPLPTSYYAAGQDTAGLILGYAERFSSPFTTTYLDSVSVVLEIDRLDAGVGNGVAIVAVPEYIASGHYFANLGAQPFAGSEILPGGATLGSTDLYTLPMNHSVVDSDFFVAVTIPSSQISHDSLWLFADSVTSKLAVPFSEERDRSRLILRELYAGSIEYGMAGTKWAGYDTSLYWYPNFEIIAYISSPTGSVAEIYPMDSDPLNFFVERTMAGETYLNFKLAQPSEVQVSLFDEDGRMVAALIDDFMIEGTHSVPFFGTGLPGGRYFCRINAENKSEVRPVVVVR